MAIVHIDSRISYFYSEEHTDYFGRLGLSDDGSGEALRFIFSLLRFEADDCETGCNDEPTL